MHAVNFAGICSNMHIVQYENNNNQFAAWLLIIVLGIFRSSNIMHDVLQLMSVSLLRMEIIQIVLSDLYLLL